MSVLEIQKVWVLGRYLVVGGFEVRTIAQYHTAHFEQSVEMKSFVLTLLFKHHVVRNIGPDDLDESHHVLTIRLCMLSV